MKCSRSSEDAPPRRLVGNRPAGSGVGAGAAGNVNPVKSYRCRVCDNPLYFENSVCVSCGTALGFSRDERSIVPVDQTGRYVDASGAIWWVCANLNLSGCTWLAPVHGETCFA